MIDDLELRGLFKVESEEHLQTLEDGLLRLEANPEDTAILEDLFRSAHSLKGASRMLGVTDLETLAHHFEDELGAARRGNRPLTSESADRLYHGLDAMRQLAKEACGGEDAQVDLPGVLALLRGKAIPGKSTTVPRGQPLAVEIAAADFDKPSQPPLHRDLQFQIHAEPNAPPLRIAPTANATVIEAFAETPIDSAVVQDEAYAPAVNAFKTETIRVEPQKLDALMTLAGEMVVTTARTVRALGVVGELNELWEEWNRDAPSSNFAAPPLGRTQPLTDSPERESARLKRLRSIVDRLERTRDQEIGSLGLVADDMIESIREIRLLPFSTIFNLFLRLVRDLSHEQGKKVRLEIEGGGLTADKHLLEELKDPLMHMIRNAIDHAIEQPEERERRGKPREAIIWLRAYRTSSSMVVEIADDGRGLNDEAIRRTALQKHALSESEISTMSHEQLHNLIFLPAFSTTSLITDVSGRGVGLDVVRTNIDRLKGVVSVHSEAGRGCTFRIEAPITLAMTRILVIQIAQRSYAIPIEAVQETFLVSPTAIFAMEGRPCMQWATGPVRVERLADLLELLPDRAVSKIPKAISLPGVLLAIGTERFGLFVDALLDEQEVILKPFGGLLKRVRNVLGSTILSNGEICMILNPRDLIKSMRVTRTSAPVAEPTEEERKKVILLAEDSITTRTQEKRILEGAGYEVVTAVDGADAFSKLGTRAFDAVVTDLEMPNMTGLQLAEWIRREAKYKELPIILVTSLGSDEDRQRGVEVGANAYITKGNFDQKLLIDTLRRLV
jgi:two-component system chemotaxis sensor kinase CheA